MLIRALLIACLCVLSTGMSRPVQAQVALNLRDADLNSFIQIIAESTGRNFVLDPRVAGRVTIVVPEDIPSDAIYDVFLNVLELNRLTVIDGTDVSRIVPIDIAGTLSSDPVRTRTASGGYETRVIALQNVTVAEVVEVVRPLLPPEAVLSTVPARNLLILSDRGTNQRRIAALINKLDAPAQTELETIRLRNGNAPDLAEVIRGLEILPAGATIAGDGRSNAIIVSGPEEFRRRVRLLVNQLDRPTQQLSTAVVRLNYADASKIEGAIRSSFAGGGAATAEGGQAGAPSGVTVVAEPQQNALIITAPERRLHSIVAAVRQLDRQPKQVLIEAVIFEISVDTFSDLSTQFGSIVNGAVAGGVQFAMEGRPTLTGLVTSILAGTGSAPNTGDGVTFGGFRGSNRNGFGAFLTALASETSTRLLATPSIMTLNNEEAKIVVAQNVPFVTGSFATVGDSAIPEQPFQTIQRQDVGLELTVTPQITADKNVRLSIAHEVSNLTNTASAAGGEITSKREINTNVLVGDGRVIMLGGLLENGNGSVDKRVPGLSNIPLLGQLFKGRNVNGAQRVLLIMMRPRIVSTDAEARKLTQELTRQAKVASAQISPNSDTNFPFLPDSGLPFDGYDLNQPFGAGFIDDYARHKLYPPLPSRLKFTK